MKKILIILITGIAIFPMSVFQAHCAGNNTDPVIRVSIINDRDSFNLALKGRYKVYALNSDRVVMEGPYLSAVVKPFDGGIIIGKKDIRLQGVKIKVERDANIYVESKRFRGDIDILRRDNGKLTVVNYIPLDEYLYGVLYHEVSHRWPMDVIKAQAVAARTFALYQSRQNKLQPYDLRNDIYSQVYGGRNSEKWSTTRAVNLTRNEVLAYKGDLIPAYYHATCAGHTEDASNLWNIDVPYLDGVECNYCKASKHYKWNKEIPLWQLSDKLNKAGYKIGRILEIKILSKNNSGRVDKLEIKDDSGVTLILTGKDFRQIIGPNELRSTKFNLEINRKSLILEGNGWGHGVGMCQWGAYGMSKLGIKYDDILKHYYPGTEITTISKLKR